jgi:hypothetical protein
MKQLLIPIILAIEAGAFVQIKLELMLYWLKV